MTENILENVRLSFVSRRNYLETELKQSAQEGKSVEGYQDRIQQIRTCEDVRKAEEKALALYQTFQELEVSADFPYQEPETLEAIEAMLPADAAVSADNIKGRILGAWVGRAAGCLLGQPVEGWKRERILGFLKASGNYPIQRYMSSDVPQKIRQEYEIKDTPGQYGNEKIGWINNVDCMPEDDDMNYTVMGLQVIEKYGRDFTPMDVAEFLTTNIPVFMTCTAERMAYKNIVNGILPPESAAYGNPYREWLGAQIRVDAYAYVNPGNAGEAVRMAVRDASISHRKNGIYGAAFCAALIAKAAVCKDAQSAIEAALAYIPQKSRLSARMKEFLQEWNRCGDAEKMLAGIHMQYDETDLHDWCHVIPNDMIICLALLSGGTDYTKVIGTAVEAGFDTDCNAATAGSVFGMMYGIEAIPEQWKEPLNGRMITRIGCRGIVSFEELADRCIGQFGQR